MNVKIFNSEKIIHHKEIGDCKYYIDPYIGCSFSCHYCFSQNDFHSIHEESLYIHGDFETRLRNELKNIEPQKIFIGFATDPYQPIEDELKQTKTTLEVLDESGFNVSIVTKSHLILRDKHIIKRMAGSSVGTSVAFREESIRNLFEPNTPDNEYRFQLLKEFKNDKIHTFILICPIIPFYTDIEYLIAKSAPVANDIWFYRLILNNPDDINWKNLSKILDSIYPGFSEENADIFFNSSNPYWDELRKRLNIYQNSTKLNLKIFI
ncbi:MAG: radical SAM protein [bacterium]|nr:radical SAM protein [bacterium]